MLVVITHFSLLSFAFGASFLSDERSFSADKRLSIDFRELSLFSEFRLVTNW